MIGKAGATRPCYLTMQQPHSIAEQSEQVFNLARASAMRSLARKENSSAELAKRLTQQGFSAEVVVSVIDYCIAHHWLDDDRYGAMMVRAGANKGHGPLRIRFDLRKKGLSDSQISHALDQSEFDWFAQAMQLLARRVDASQLQEFKMRMKWLKFLLSRGFSQDEARFAIMQLQHPE